MREHRNIDTLYKIYFRPMCMYAMHFLNDVHTSEDLVQECFMSYWERFLNISGNPSGFPASPKQYLFAMVRNRCIDLIRKESGKDSSVNLSEAERFAADEESVDMSFLEARMWTAIDSLPEKRRKIFLMAKRDGMKYEEIAEVLNISVNTFRNQMAKALDTVKSGNELLKEQEGHKSPVPLTQSMTNGEGKAEFILKYHD